MPSDTTSALPSGEIAPKPAARLALTPNERLWRAAKRGSVVGVKRALAQGALPNALDPIHGRTALMLACQSEQPNCAQALLPVSDPLLQDECGETALMVASWGANPECVRLLARIGGPLMRNKEGHTALILASGSCGRESLACVEALLPVSDPLAQCHRGQSALMWAAMMGDEGCVAALLPVSAPRAKDGDKRDALMHAALMRRLHCVKALLPVSDPLARDRWRRRASEMVSGQDGPLIKELILAREGELMAAKQARAIKRALGKEGAKAPRVARARL